MNIEQSNPLSQLLGADLKVPVFSGEEKRYINLDNAATTPSFQSVWDHLSKVMPWYGSVHRGSGLKSIISTKLFDKALESIRSFSDASIENDVLIFGWNTTSCINHLERRLELDQNSIVITAQYEHSSNVLPWRKNAKVIECNSSDDGTLDIHHLEELLRKNRVKLVAVAAASNVTGLVTDVHSIARLAHSYGAEIFVDAAQLVAHRQLIRKAHDAIDHLDYVAYSGHKMYSPFGIGVLIAKKKIFQEGWPDSPGGGTIKLIDGAEIIWSDLPSRETGGTPNFHGIIALAEACKTLKNIGFEKIKAHEHELIEYARTQFAKNENVIIHRKLTMPNNHDSIAIFPFSLNGYHPSLIGAYLGTEKAIGVRAGHLCQFALIRHILSVPEAERIKIRSQIKDGENRNLYGVVRASCGIGTTKEDISSLAIALTDLKQNGPQANYSQNADGVFEPTNWMPTFPF